MTFNCRLKATKINSHRSMKVKNFNLSGEKAVDTGVLKKTKMKTLKPCNLSEEKIDHHLKQEEKQI